jgi:hypothetical protein
MLSASVRRTYLLATESRRTLAERRTSLTSGIPSNRRERTPQLRHELALNRVTEVAPCRARRRCDPTKGPS